MTHIAEVLEADATGEIADIYADIRSTMNMSFVNLIWRKLALSPEALSWTWRTMKPLYENGAVYDESEALRGSQVLPSVPRLPTPILRGVGIDGTDEAAIRTTLERYDRGNPLNIVSFSAVLAKLSGFQPDGDPETGRAGVEFKHQRISHTPLPRLMPMDEMDDTTVELVRLFNLIGTDGNVAKVQTSLPRHLAHWPGFLSLSYAVLRPLHDDGRLRAPGDAVLEDGMTRGKRLASRMGDFGMPPPDVAKAVHGPIENIVSNAMGRMIPIVSLLLRMLPR